MNSQKKRCCLAVLCAIAGLALLGPVNVRAATLILDLSQTGLTVIPGATVIFEGTITNKTGSSLDAATDLFLNFQNFDPGVLNPVQLLGTPDFTLANGATSPLIALFSLTASSTLPSGKSSSIDVALEDGNGDLSTAATAMVTAGRVSSVPEPGTMLLTAAGLLAVGLARSRGRRRRGRFAVIAFSASALSLLAPVLANAQAPSFSTQSPAAASSGGSFNVILPLANSGAAAATNVQLTSIGLTTAGIPSGGLLQPAQLPFSIGSLDPGKIRVLDLAFDNRQLVAGKPYLVTVRGTYSFKGTTLGFAVNRPVVYKSSSPFGGSGNPLTVTPNLDASHMATMLFLAPLGGKLAATGADGTVFTLTIPPNALLSDELVTMTPITGLGGIPTTGGLLAAVHLEPDGLQLIQPATLTIQPSAGIPITDQVGFEYQGGGQNFSLAPLANTTAITLNLVHFSGHGVGAGQLSQPVSPAEAQAQLSNAAAQLLKQQRDCALAGTGCDPQNASKLDGLFQLYFDQVVVPLLQQALSDYTSAPSAITTALGWLRQVTIQHPAEGGLPEPFATDQEYIMQTIPKILTNAFEQIYGKCAATSDSSKRQDYAVQLLGIARQLDIMFGGAIKYLPDYQNQIEACAVGPLDLGFDSHASGSQVSGVASGSENSHVQAQSVHLTPDRGGVYHAGGATLKYLSFSLSGPYCAIITSTNPGTLDVTGKFDLNIFPMLQPPTIVLTLLPKITETVKYGEQLRTCVLLPPAQTGFYEENLLVAHTPDTAASYRIAVNSNQAVSFSGAVTNQLATSTATEDSTITLKQSNP